MESLLTLGEYKEVYFRLDFEWLKNFSVLWLKQTLSGLEKKLP